VPNFTLNVDNLLTLYREKRHDALTDEIMAFIGFALTNGLEYYTEQDQMAIDVMATTLFTIIAAEDYEIPEDKVLWFIIAAHLFSNLAAVTSHGTTDEYLKIVLKQKRNLPKVLTLYNVRCKTEISLKALFEANRNAATCWWVKLLEGSRGILPEHQAKLERIATDPDALALYSLAQNNYRMFDWLTHAAFTISYIKPEAEREVRTAINKEISNIVIKKKDDIKYDFKKILVVSHFMRKEHAVYKSIVEYFRALKPKYHLTYLNLSPDTKHHLLDYGLFDDIIFATNDKGYLQKESIQKVEEGDFGIIIYPDISLSFNSLALASARLAPIQISTYGHPVSSYLDNMDYYIAGQATEVKGTYKNYSERLVLIPGQGNCPQRQTYLPSMPEDSEYLVSCSWGFLKLNSSMLELLQRIRDKATKPIKYVFAGIHAQSFNLLAIKKEMANYFGADGFTITPTLKHDSYMKHIEVCKFGVDSYPFGGFNRVIDTLLTGRPILVLEGNKAYNRMNAAMLRRAGLGRLVVESFDELEAHALKIIDEEEYRLELMDEIRKADLFNEDEAKYFRKAIDFLVDNHGAMQTFKAKSPIKIRRDNA